MSNDEMLKKLQGLKNLNHAIELMRSAELEKAAPPSEQPVAVEQQAKPVPQIKHMGIHNNKGNQVVSHKIGIPGLNSHYEIDVNMEHLKDGKIPAYTVHKVDSEKGHTLESCPIPHKNISSAVKALMSHAHKGNWEE